MLIKQLSNALGAHGDLGVTRDAVVAFLKERGQPNECVGTFWVWLQQEEPTAPQGRWFQKVLVTFLRGLHPSERVANVVGKLSAAPLPPTPAETLEKRAERFLVPGVRHRLLVAARRARLRERALGARF